MTSKTRITGITVFPEYIQTEGIDGVLHSVMDIAGVNAVSISPYVMAPADAATGTREPPADASAGSVRLLDRPLWGRRELFVRTAPSFVPDKTLYAGLRYQPPETDELTHTAGQIVRDFVLEAKKRGLMVFHQVQSAIPPGYRVQFGGPVGDDIPLTAAGVMPKVRVDNNGSLASPHIRAYADAMTRDLLQAYPEIDGLRIDWPEYPPYTLDSLFLDFGDHARAAAARLGFDFPSMRADTLRLREAIAASMSNSALEQIGPGDIEDALSGFPGVVALFNFKAALAGEIVAVFRSALADAGGEEKLLFPSIFPPPWSRISGANTASIAAECDLIGVKFYTMHWPMMLRFYCDTLLAERPDLDRATLMRTLGRLFEIIDTQCAARDDYAYPEPEEAHPVGSQAMADKLRMVVDQAGDRPIVPIVHGYGPAQDFKRRLEAVTDPSSGNFWINRYGYLSDEKLHFVGAHTRCKISSQGTLSSES